MSSMSTIPSLTATGLYSGESHLPGHGWPGPHCPWDSVIWGSTQSENDPGCTLKMIKKHDTMQSSGVLKLNMTTPENLEENLAHELGDCVLRMFRDQMCFWTTEPLSLLNCVFIHIAVDFCWLPLLSSQLHVRVIPTSHVWVLIFVHLLPGFTFM
jgi:hypothetical protein